MEFPTASPQLQTVLAFLKAVSDQNPDEVISYMTDDAQYHWVTPGFEALGPRVKNKMETREFFAQVSGTFVKDFKVRFISDSITKLKPQFNLPFSISYKITSRCQEKWSSRYAENPVI